MAKGRRGTWKIFHSPFSRKRLLVSEKVKVNARRHAATKSSAHPCNFFVLFLFRCLPISLFLLLFLLLLLLCLLLRLFSSGLSFFLFSSYIARARISKRVCCMQRNENAPRSERNSAYCFSPDRVFTSCLLPARVNVHRMSV